MARFRLIAVVVAAMCWAGLAAAQEPAAVAHPEQLGFAPDRLQRLTDAYKGYVDHGDLPGAVLLIARGDKIAYFEAIGFQDRAKNTPMTKDALFRLASMTKPIVSVAAMLLVEEGKIDLLAPVSKYLPEFKDLKVGVEQTDLSTGKKVLSLEPQHRPMIVQDLMRHTSGLIYPLNGDGLVYQTWQKANVSDRGQTLAEMVTKMSHLPLAHQPGKVWEYSMSVDVLGRIVEIVSGKDLDVFVNERIAKPLGMASTDFYVHEGDIGRLAQAQAPPAGSDLRMPPDVSKKPRFFSGGGGLVASAGDYLHFAEMLLHQGEYGNTRLLAPHTVKLMTSNALPPGIGYADIATRFGDIAPTPEMGQGFGLGFAVRTAEGRNPLPGSVGNFYWTGAWGTTFWVDPREKLIAIQMIQTPTTIGSPFRRAFRELTYAAMTGNDGEH
ncbi:MAG TPA: serine hydrolase domain-containing protein [Stellaceae bacterium]|jgi:CubicO group peptidase (beta-lactamase class C family)|nr:serine hydrolase domain-containing protein [Stellaceae bacterium]